MSTITEERPAVTVRQARARRREYRDVDRNSIPSARHPLMPKDWVASHIIDGTRVMRVQYMKENTKPTAKATHYPVTHYFTAHGRETRASRKYPAVPIEVIDLHARPVLATDLAYDRGFADGRAAREKEEHLDIEATFAYPRREFRARDIAPAFMSILAAHEGSPLIMSPDCSEGEYKERDEDGAYYVMARIYDWGRKTHLVYKLRIPEKMIFEVVQDHNPN